MFIAVDLTRIFISLSSKGKNIRLIYMSSSKFIKSKPKSRNLPTPLLRDTQRSLEIEVLNSKLINFLFNLHEICREQKNYF